MDRFANGFPAFEGDEMRERGYGSVGRKGIHVNVAKMKIILSVRPNAIVKNEVERTLRSIVEKIFVDTDAIRVI